jgi:hypothetical protein
MTAILVASLAHLGLSAGAGAGHGFFGPQAEIRFGHLAVDAGLGVADAPFADLGAGIDWHLSPAAGFRYFFDEDGTGIYLSVHGAYFSDRKTDAFDQAFEDRHRQAYGVTIGFRRRYRSGIFADLGIGMAVQILQRTGVDQTGGARVAFEHWLVRPGWIWRDGSVPIPDVDIALGFEF